MPKPLLSLVQVHMGHGFVLERVSRNRHVEARRMDPTLVTSFLEVDVFCRTLGLYSEVVFWRAAGTNAKMYAWRARALGARVSVDLKRVCVVLRNVDVKIKIETSKRNKCRQKKRRPVFVDAAEPSESGEVPLKGEGAPCFICFLLKPATEGTGTEGFFLVFSLPSVL